MTTLCSYLDENNQFCQINNNIFYGFYGDGAKLGKKDFPDLFEKDRSVYTIVKGESIEEETGQRKTAVFLVIRNGKYGQGIGQNDVTKFSILYNGDTSPQIEFDKYISSYHFEVLSKGDVERFKSEREQN